MTRRCIKIAPLILLLLLAFNLCFSQKLDYRLGEIIFSLAKGEDISSLESELRSKAAFQRASFDISKVSQAFNTWKIRFDHSRIHQLNFLQELKQNPLIAQAQLNHFLDNRNLPNDPFFNTQWHLYNTGQNGTNFGIDLDMPLAWEQSTGGLSFTGDTVVICIIDEFFNYQHEDLSANAWINFQEIPDNEIDDDGNGFVDDYYGWNVTSGSDDISNSNLNDWHGTSVAGVAGAVGNNEKGISGICWNIKMMMVSRGSTTADAIEAYSYPFLNRKLYNESQGQTGAFVVATNASWGLDFAFPSDAPLWCAMYDSLGSVGILNSAATTNANYNVDVVGDLPTTCTSPYLITTTSVGSDDQKIENAGYGDVSIDLAAFGSAILSTHEGNSYDVISGTSVASPQISGAIGLLHTAPCPSFASFAKSNPATAALNLKSYLLEGVEDNASLEGLTVTGGRLNVNNSMELLLGDCDYSGCFTPYDVDLTLIDTNAVTIDWITEVNTIEINARYRPAGANEWINIYDVSSPMQLTDLISCSNYEFQLQSICQNSESAFTASFSFTTDGCCNAPTNIETFAGNNSIIVNWSSVTSANAYKVKYRVAGTLAWEAVETTESFYLINELESCQAYEIQLSTICADGQLSPSGIKNSTTKGCGSCLDLSYCTASGASNSDRWINRIKINDWEHYSTLDISTGYQDFTDQNIMLFKGGVHILEIDTDHDFFAPGGYFHIWLDLDQDGSFTTEELLFQSNMEQYQVDNILAIPNNCQLGSTRMRVAFANEIIEPCTNSTLLGEVEDYCVDIIETNECLPPINFTEITSEGSAGINWSGDLLINEYLFFYKPQASNEEWTSIEIFNNNIQLENLSPCTDYDYFVHSLCDGEASLPGSLQHFRTKGCGICIDAEYCPIQEEDNSTQFEWIEKVVIGDVESNSGQNAGYLLVPDLSINLGVGQFYQIVVTPGFANEADEEYYSIWLDINSNGLFEASELLTQGYTSSYSAFDTFLFIPETSIAGSTRMRISMKYGAISQDACEAGFEGETEDYCVNIIPGTGTTCDETYISNVVGLDSASMLVEWAELEGSNAYRFRYRPKNLDEADWSIINTGISQVVFATGACEMQEFQVQAKCANGWSAYSELVEFNSCDNLVPVSEVESISESKFSVYPNPSVGNAVLQMHLAKQERLDIFIYSAVGELLEKFSLASPDVGADQILLPALPSGIYFLQILENNRSIYSTKIIAQAP